MVESVPPGVTTDGADACWLTSAYGLVPDEWQRRVVAGWLRRRVGGGYSASRCGLAVPRQNGKNGVLEVVELFKMVAQGRRVLHTAHEVKTARKAFLRLASFFENPRKAPELASMVAYVRRTNGQEAVVLNNGGSCEFIARSKGSGRGFTVDDLVMDEAQELSEDALAALLPTISAAPSGKPQQLMTGTPPGPNMKGDAWTRVRQAGLEGTADRLAWFEWSAERGVNLDDRQAWADANPALGGRVGVETIVDERLAMDDDTFARERLGMWSAASTTAVIDPVLWSEIADERSLATDALALAVDIAPDRSSSSVALAGRRDDGLYHVELDEQKNGVGWVVPYLRRLLDANPNVRALVIDAASPAASLADELSRERVRVTTTNTREYAAACGHFYDGVMEQWLRHTGQPAMTYALASARTRSLGDAWAWNRKNAASDITPIVAATLALWGAQSSTVKRPARKRGGGRRVVVA